MASSVKYTIIPIVYNRKCGLPLSSPQNPGPLTPVRPPSRDPRTPVGCDAGRPGSLAMRAHSVPRKPFAACRRCEHVGLRRATPDAAATRRKRPSHPSPHETGGRTAPRQNRHIFKGFFRAEVTRTCRRPSMPGSGSGIAQPALALEADPAAALFLRKCTPNRRPCFGPDASNNLALSGVRSTAPETPHRHLAKAAQTAMAQ